MRRLSLVSLILLVAAAAPQRALAQALNSADPPAQAPAQPAAASPTAVDERAACSR